MPTTLRHSQANRAFERLYRAHVGDVYRYALAVLGNVADAEDVAQTTFMNAYRALARGEDPATPQNWLIAIAHNVVRQRFRQAARRPTEVRFDEDVAEAAVPSDEAPTAADIQRALGHLAFNQRAVLVLRELEGRSNAEIAEVLCLTTTAVEMLLFRARRALREQLDGSLTCEEAEAAISRQLDGRLTREGRGALRAHVRECDECARLARRQRAQRSAWKSLAAAPLPLSLSSVGGGAGVAGGVAGAGLAAKAAAVIVSAAFVGGGGYEVARHTVLGPPPESGFVSVFSTPRAGKASSQPPHRVRVQPRRVSRPTPTVHRLGVSQPTVQAPAPSSTPAAETTPPTIAAAHVDGAHRPAPRRIHPGKARGTAVRPRSRHRSAAPPKQAMVVPHPVHPSPPGHEAHAQSTPRGPTRP
jgi:RNA polymerase sigma-70 factor (ECF subfamily)